MAIIVLGVKQGLIFIGVLVAAFAMHNVCFAKLAPSDTTANPTLDSILAGPGIRWSTSDVSRTIRRRVHLSASRVPRFPQEDPSFMDPSKWPTVKVIEGVACSLRIATGQHDAIWFVRSLKDVKPGANYTLFYSGVQDESWRFDHRGPTYCWRGDGTLIERYWSSEGVRGYETWEYMYYRSGELFRFTDRRGGHDLQTDSRNPLEWLDEVFARGGTLIGFGYWRRGRGEKSLSVGYWLAKEMAPQEFHRLEAEAQTRALK